MAFAMIGERARAHLALPDETSAVLSADSTVAVLRADYERWSRWLMGLAAYALAVVGSFGAVGMIVTMLRPGMRVSVVDVVVVIIALAVAAAGVWLLVRLWLSGRRMLRAATAWMRLPYIRGARARSTRGWVLARTTNFEPRIFIRLVTVSLALLMAVSGIALFFRGVVEGFDVSSVAALVVGLISLASGLGQAGGVMRLVSGMSEADPLWVRLRSLFRS